MNLKIFMMRWPVILIMSVVLASLVLAKASIKVPGITAEVWGTGMTFTNLDSNPRPEMILVVYDISKRPNTFHYRIGWNVDHTGAANRWGDDVEIPGVGWNALGAGAAVTQLDSDPRPEIILMIYFDFEWKTFRYKVGWNLEVNGLTTNWSRGFIEVPGVGWLGGGAGIAIAQLDDNPKPDMVLMAYDDPPGKNFFRYRIGWNLDSNGNAPLWSNYQEVEGMADKGTGAGVALVHLDDNPGPEMILTAYSIFPDRPPCFQSKIGWNLNSSGITTDWRDYLELPGLEPEAKGADICFFNFDEDNRPEFIFMAFYQPSETKESYFGYHVLKDKFPAKRIYLEMDKLSSVKWPPDRVVREEATHSLQGIYAPAGIHLDTHSDDGSIPDIKGGQPYTDAEIHSFLFSYQDDTVPSDAWPLYAAIFTTQTQGTAGMMFTLNQRRGVVVFADKCSDDAEYLRTLAHQIGVALNLKYSDGDAWQGCFTYSKGCTLMNPVWKLADDWNFTWSAASLSHFYYHLPNSWKPQQKNIFINCH